MRYLKAIAMLYVGLFLAIIYWLLLLPQMVFDIPVRYYKKALNGNCDSEDNDP